VQAQDFSKPLEPALEALVKKVAAALAAKAHLV
jgi:hypothetical protein